MNFPLRFSATPLLLGALTLAIPSAVGAVPEGFTIEPALPGVTFVMPTAFAFLPDSGLLVAEGRGLVHLVRGGVKLEPPLWDGTVEVLGAVERGLMGLAVDPDFAANRRLYFLFTADPDSDGVDDDDDAYGRLVSYQMSATNPDSLDLSTRRVLFGATWADGAPSGSNTHTVDGLVFGEDGTLLVSIGDGAQFTVADTGGLDPGLFEPGRADSAQDIGAFRSRSLESLDGKILRLDPETGHGLPSNPWWDGDSLSVRSRVWAHGLRNPFRFAVRPGSGSADPAAGDPGTLYIGDVGWQDWEEVSIAPAGGLNFGWPCLEGPVEVAGYAAAPVGWSCDSAITPQHPAPPTAPLMYWSHSDPGLGSPPGFAGIAAVGGVFTPQSWPVDWRGVWLFADYGLDWIRVLVPTANDSIDEVRAFADGAGGAVSFAVDPTSQDVWYIALYSGELMRIHPDSLTPPPPPPPPPPPLPALLDDFDRADGPVGNGWIGHVAGLFVSDSALVQTTTDSWAFWPDTFAADQHAWMRFEAIAVSAPEHNLMLKGQGDSWSDGHIEVRHDHTSNLALVNTYTPPPGPGWENRGGPWPLVLGPGDVFGARARADGTVEVLLNDSLVATASVAGWPFAALGGRVGLTLVGASGVTRISDFGGGPVSDVVNAAPIVTIASPAESLHYAIGQPLALEAVASDPDDSTATLVVTWQVTALRAGGPVVLFADTGATSAFVPGPPDSGEHLEIRAVATDPHGAADTAVVVLDPAPTLGVGETWSGLSLSPARPNPSRSDVSFGLVLPRAARVRFEVLDLAGRVVWRAGEEARASGSWRLAWDGARAGGDPAPAGLYFARVTVDGVSLARRFVRLR